MRHRTAPGLLMSLLSLSVFAAEEDRDSGRKADSQSGQSTTDNSVAALPSEWYLQESEQKFEYSANTGPHRMEKTERALRLLFGIDADLDTIDWDKLVREKEESERWGEFYQSPADEGPSVGLTRIGLFEVNDVKISLSIDFSGMGLPSVELTDIVGGWVDVELLTFP